MQFGLSASFHFLFVPLSLGLLLCMNLLQTAHAINAKPEYEQAAAFWSRFYFLCWVVGVITGYALRFQLQNDWGLYAKAATPVLKEIFAMEAAIGPFMVVGVLITSCFRGLVNSKILAIIGWLLLSVMMMQALTILSVNAWMQHPVGVAFEQDAWKLLNINDILFSNTAIEKFCHTLSAAMLTGAFFVLALSASYMLKGKRTEAMAVSMRLGAWLSVVGVVCMLTSGHESAEGVSKAQPMKFASMEGHWKTESGPASLTLFAIPDETNQRNRYALEVPYVLSLLTYASLESPPGIIDVTNANAKKIENALQNKDAIKASGWLALRDAMATRDTSAWSVMTKAEQVQMVANTARPNVTAIFTAFHVMVFSGIVLLFLSIWIFIHREALSKGQRPVLLKTILWCAPLPWVATLSGWAVAEIGRQPWTVYEQLPTLNASQLPVLGMGVISALLSMFLIGIVITTLFLLISRVFYHAGSESKLFRTKWAMLNKLA